MNKKSDMSNNPNSRRNFVRKLALTSLVTFSLPKLGTFANSPIDASKSNDGNGMVFLFQGDSITDGNRGRNTDPNHIMGHGYAFSIASSLGADFPEKKLTFYNRGISGNKVTDLANRWQKDTLDLKPNVLSILVGINDASSVVFPHPEQVTAEKYEEVYRLLLSQTKAQFPEILFVLCNPFILPVGKVKENWDAYKTDLAKRQSTVLKLVNEFDTVFVDFQQVFDQACKRANADYWIWDGVHPTVAGHELMAREWRKQVGKRLKFVS
jgi:lysophospholipase L1-like esterase